MKFEVYCDESRPELIGTERPTANFTVIGSIWLPAAAREDLKTALHALRDKHKVGGEFKWQKASHSRLEFYRELVRWFFTQGNQLRFRCIVIDHRKVDLNQFHQNDPELGFYKFYYQLLHHWILDWNEYAVFCDFKSNRKRDRLQVLKKCLEHTNLSSQITAVQAIRSRESVLLQLVDVLTGAAAARLNESTTPEGAKEAVVALIERLLGRPIKHTVRGEQKFNVFVIDLEGGW